MAYYQQGCHGSQEVSTLTSLQCKLLLFYMFKLLFDWFTL